MSRLTCNCDLDDPCFCFPELANPAPKYVIRHSVDVIVATGIIPRGGVA